MSIASNEGLKANRRGLGGDIAASRPRRPMRPALTIRMTGCPNGCARPPLAEIGIAGLGATSAPALRPSIARYAAERFPNESFGDFSARAFEFITA